MKLPSVNYRDPSTLPPKKRKIAATHFNPVKKARSIGQRFCTSDNDFIIVPFGGKLNSNLAPTTDLNLGGTGKHSSKDANVKTENPASAKIAVQPVQVRVEKNEFHDQRGTASKKVNCGGHISNEDKPHPAREKALCLLILQRERRILHLLEILQLKMASLLREISLFRSAHARRSGASCLSDVSMGPMKRARQDWTEEENTSFFKVMGEMEGLDDRKCIKELKNVLQKRNYEQIRGKIKNMREVGRLPPKGM